MITVDKGSNSIRKHWLYLHLSQLKKEKDMTEDDPSFVAVIIDVNIK